MQNDKFEALLPAITQGEQVIGVHIGLPPGLQLPHAWPENNFAGAFLARDLIKNLLRAVGVLNEAQTVGCAGSLNDCVILAAVTDSSAAVAALKEYISESLLGRYFTVATRQGLNWVQAHPNPGASANWLLDTERHELANEKLEAALRDSLTAQVSYLRALLNIPPEHLQETLAEAEAALASLQPDPEP